MIESTRIDPGMEAEKRKQQEFFDLAESEPSSKLAGC
jgi:hypothetical protein